jgi:hypothetical protein
MDHVGFRSSTQPTLISYLLLLPKPEQGLWIMLGFVPQPNLL